MTIAKDGTGRVAVLFLGDKKQTPTADAFFHNDDAIRAAGLTGEVEVAVFRAPLPFRRRVAYVAPVVASVAPTPRPRSRQRAAAE